MPCFRQKKDIDEVKRDSGSRRTLTRGLIPSSVKSRHSSRRSGNQFLTRSADETPTSSASACRGWGRRRPARMLVAYGMDTSGAGAIAETVIPASRVGLPGSVLFPEPRQH
jgi:hypothetical protein